MKIIERAIQSAAPKGGRKTGADSGHAARHSGQRTTATGEVVKFTSHVYGSGGSLVTDAMDRPIYEQFRRLKRPLLQAAFGPQAESGLHVIMVTSPLPGAGKTFVSTNLAYVMAMEKDRNVLLIDMDNIRRSLTIQQGLEGRPGIFDIIGDEQLPLDEAIFHADLPGLSIIPAGKPGPDSLERLTSSRCQEIFRHIRTSDPTRLVILDAPPLLASSDGPLVGALAGQSLLVVEAGVTAKSSVQKSISLLNGSKPIGLILNKTPGEIDGGLYYAE
jgi:receptor protein-tyrosine kinase